jgi:hypothetical protein
VVILTHPQSAPQVLVLPSINAGPRVSQVNGAQPEVKFALESDWVLEHLARYAVAVKLLVLLSTPSPTFPIPHPTPATNVRNTILCLLALFWRVQVHQAVWKSTTCAVKTLFANDRMSAVDKAKMQDSFQREAALLCHLRHPNIVNVLAVSLAELTLVMVR